ncbi:MAG: Chromosome partition protein Smc [Gammaproteobacteria bacterium]|nr:Chromosome partition protein Smc [Gammaproteobacteria bacterium]
MLRTTNDLIIKPRLTSTVRLAVAVAGIALIAGAALVGYWGGRAAMYDKLESRNQQIDTLGKRLHEGRTLRRNLETQLDNTRRKLDATHRQLAKTKSSLTKVTGQLQIDNSAYKELRRELEASTQEIAELGSELKFYRSIISPADGRSGVRIQDFNVQPTDSEYEYRYRLTLIQALEQKDPVKGIVRFEIAGSEEGTSRIIRSPGGPQQHISVEFKYFQNFAGTFSLPAEFIPAEIQVIFEADDNAVVQRLYPWPQNGAPENA